MYYSFFHPYGPTSSTKEVPIYLKNIKPKVSSFGKPIKKKRKVKKKRKIKKKRKVKRKKN
jgi:hypothetical protein|tara:strand:- start:27 stop:206 length:180 start_codon:yes stop_codon:yes gene_type:complete